MNKARRLTYDFLGLPFITKIGIILDLGLVTEEDVEKAEGRNGERHLFIQAFRKAKQTGQVRRLEEKIRESKQ